MTPDLDFRIYDVGAKKELRSFPKKGSDPEKAAACAEAFAGFKKEVLTFAKLRSELLHKMHLSGEYVNPELWRKVYVDHPVIRHLAQLVVWQDEADETFIIEDGKTVNAHRADYVPNGKIRVAHVLNMKSADIDAWQQMLGREGRKQIFRGCRRIQPVADGLCDYLAYCH